MPYAPHHITLPHAIQLGLRGDILARYAHEWIVNIEDITPFVHEQHCHVLAHDETSLIIPQELVYPSSIVA